MNDQSQSQNNIKSPSDTTVYAPALRKKLTPNHDEPVFGNNNDQREHNMVFLGSTKGNIPDVYNVANFIEQIRIDQHPDDNCNPGEYNHIDRSNTDFEEAQRKAERSIIEVEKFRASIKQPGMFSAVNEYNGITQHQITHGASGTVPPPMNGVNAEANGRLENGEGINLLNVGSSVSDDDFFHLTCHIEPSLIHKIEKGEFIELEKLLPKDKLGGRNEESRLE